MSEANAVALATPRTPAASGPGAAQGPSGRARAEDIAFVQDLRLPGMLHGRVVRPPRYGAKLESFDEARIKAMPGVVAVVRDGSFLGVVARREEQAIKAAAALSGSAKWVTGPELPDPSNKLTRPGPVPPEETFTV